MECVATEERVNQEAGPKWKAEFDGPPPAPLSLWSLREPFPENEKEGGEEK